jgi:hypothetical protein
MMVVQMIISFLFSRYLMTKPPFKAAENTNIARGQSPFDSKAKQILLKEIGAKWSKFSEQELSSLKNKDDLVAQVVSKYGLAKSQAQRDVGALMQGRQT